MGKIFLSTKETYLSFIRNSVGSKSFRNYYIKIDGKKRDIMRDGELSCAFFVSSVLVLFNMLKRVHGTVKTTIGDLKKSGWREVEKPKIGSIIVWEEIDFGNSDKHGHIGFFVGNRKAISNSFKLRRPSLHHWQFNGKRKIKHIFWHNKLN